MSFYLTLPSSVRLTGLADNNTSSHYLTRIERPLDLPASEWEVGLSEIIFPSSSFNVSSGTITVTIFRDTEATIPFKHGEYGSIESLTAYLNETKKVRGFTDEDFRFVHLRKANKFAIICYKQPIRIYITGDLARALGFPGGINHGVGTHFNTHPLDYLAETGLLYVYSSLAAPRAVGESMVPLLRVFSAEGLTENGMKHLEFKHIQYVPIQNLSTDLVEIDIRRDDGTPASFKTGKVVVTVHLRKKS